MARYGCEGWWRPLMMALLAVVLGLAIAPGVVRADGFAAEGAAIWTIIEAQIDAFRHDDAPAAFAFASPRIQGMFRTPGAFMDMVRRSYPSVYRPRKLQFGALEVRGDKLLQRVHILGPDAIFVVAFYIMGRQPDNSWRVDGCTLLRDPGIET